MAFDFPNTPTIGSTTTNTKGDVYSWDGVKWIAAGTSLSGGGITEAPTDGLPYARQGSSNSWLPVVVASDTPPASPADNQLWFDTAHLDMYFRYDDGTSAQWVIANKVNSAIINSIYVGDVPPISAAIGALWFDSASLQTYLYYSDGNSVQWVAANAFGLLSVSAGIPDAPFDGTTYGRDNGNWVGVVPSAGGTMTGSLTLSGDPTSALQAATKQYVDAHGSGGGATVIVSDTPPSVTPGAFWFDSVGLQLYIGYHDPNSTQWVPASNLGGTGAFLELTGGTLSGALTLPADPTGTYDAATKHYVDTQISAIPLGSYLPLAGGTLTGSVRFGAVPAIPGDQNWAGTIYSFGQSISPAGYIGFNTYLTSVPSWRYRANGYAGQFYLDANNGSAVIGTLPNATAGATAGAQNGQWQFQQGGNFVSSGAVVASNVGAGGQMYLAGDGSTRTLNLSANYAIQLVMSNGNIRFIQAGAEVFTVGNTGNVLAQGTIAGSDIVANSGAVYPNHNTSSDYYLSGDGTNLYLRWQSGWALEWQRSTGTMFFTRAGSNWFYWRAPDALVYNALAPVGGVGPYVDVSDIRGKRDVKDSLRGLEEILKLRPISYTRLPRTDHQPPPERREIGFSAQDLQSIIPEAVVAIDDELAITTTAIIAALVNSVKELEERLTQVEGHV